MNKEYLHASPGYTHEDEADAHCTVVQTGRANPERTTALFRQWETSFSVHQDGNPAPFRCNRAQRPAPHGIRQRRNVYTWLPLHCFHFAQRAWIQPGLIERQLAHGERNDVRAAYNYAEYLPERRKMMQEWADYLTTLKRR